MTRKLPVYLVAGLALLMLFTVWIGQIPLWSSDEGRYGNIAREMWETKDFIVPHFYGMEYLEKPVLAPLLTALPYALLGVNEFSTRAIPIAAGLLGILFTFLFTRKIFDERTGNLAALILTTTVGYVLVGRFAVIDMLMTLLMTTACFSFMTAYFTRQRNYYLIAYTAMGFAFLTKGLIGMVLPAGIYFLFLIWMGQLREIKSMKLGWGILILFVIIAPWMILISQKEPKFFDIFIIEHHFKRFLTGSFGRKKPFWFFLPIFFATALPWSFFLPAALWKDLRKENPERDKVRFLVCWITVIFVFFSIPKSKLAYYLLPLSPAVAALLGSFFSKWMSQTTASEGASGNLFLKRTWIFLIGFLFTVAPALLLFSIALFFFPIKAELNSLKLIFAAAGILFLVAASWVRRFWKEGRKKPLLLTLAGMIYVFLILTFSGMIQLTPYQSTFAYAKVLNERVRPEDFVGIFASPDKYSDFPFYLKHPIVIIGSDRGTLRIASDNNKAYEKHFMSLGDFAHFFKEKKVRAYCLLAEKKLEDLKRDGITEFRVIKKDHGKILISNL